MKNDKKAFMASHILLAILLAEILFFQNQKKVQPNTAFLTCIGLIEMLYLIMVFKAARRKEKAQSQSYVVMIIWGFLLVWEWLVTKQNLMHPVLVPAPENVFYVFKTQCLTLFINSLFSLELLFISITMGLFSGVVLGIIIGWFQNVCNVIAPIANVLAPIPSVVYAPYIIAVMPSFRSASAMVIVLGIFFPNFLKIIHCVKSIDMQILDSARMLNVGNSAMITKILLPYIMPDIIAGLKVTFTNAFMLLMFAEMMGATHGLGYYIVNYNTYGNYTNVIAGIITIGILVTMMGKIISIVQLKVIKWRNA